MEHNQNDNDLLLDQFMISSYDDDDDDDDDDDQTSTMVEYQAVDDDDQFLATNILDDHPNRNSLTINFQGFSVPNHDHNIPSGDHHGSSTAAAATRSSSTSEDCATKFVAFRTKTQLETLDDGFKWRKYGKKKVKNTHNPRHYYKCSSGGCDVKKRVERDRDDSSVLITTYQGRHSHPPIHSST